MKTIYALVTDTFKSKQAIFDGSPDDEYFYVGVTGRHLNIRKREYANKAKNGATYAYYQRIRELGDNWDIVLLEEVKDNNYHDCENYWISKLTADGHILLNHKRGTRFKKNNRTISKALSSDKDYSRIEIKGRSQTIIERERKDINRGLKHIGLDESGENRIWTLYGKEIVHDRYMNRESVLEYHMPSSIRERESDREKMKKLLRLVLENQTET